MSTTSERRSSGTNHASFDALVGSAGPSARRSSAGRELSEVGMQLRTAYLPNVGQGARRFELGRDRAASRVRSEEAGKGGSWLHFVARLGQREHAAAILAGDGGSGGVAGAKVRLHIDGRVAAPRPQTARDRPCHYRAISGSSGRKSVEADPHRRHRAARIDGVGVASPGPGGPELVVAA